MKLKVDIDIYFTTLYLYIGEWRVVAKNMDSVSKEHFYGCDKQGLTYFCDNGDRFQCGIYLPMLSLEVLNHEINHAIDLMYKFVGVAHDVENTEVHSHMWGYITQKIESQLLEKGLLVIRQP